MGEAEMVIAAANQHIFSFLNRQRYLAVAVNFQIATAMRKTQTNRATAVND